jgi:hypothetical protein
VPGQHHDAHRNRPKTTADRAIDERSKITLHLDLPLSPCCVDAQVLRRVMRHQTAIIAPASPDG